MIKSFRLVLNVDDLDSALRFYRDALKLKILEAWDSPDGRGVILELPVSTLEIMDRKNANSVDELEAGVRLNGDIRLGLEVNGLNSVVENLEQHGAKPVHDAVQTPWNSLNQRLETPDAKQLTVFQERKT